MELLPYGRQTITEDDIEAVVATLQSDYLTQGPKINEFEAAFAAYVGAEYAVAVSNGTVALHLAALALGVDSSTVAITSPITFAATSNSILYCGGRVEFADVCESDANIDLDIVESMLKSRPIGYYQGLIPVDFAGCPVDLQRCRRLADQYGLWIIEDACHAPGAAFVDSAGRRHRCGDGSLADATVFSFHPVKHIACGEGGIITTNRTDLRDRLVKLRTHGITKDPAELLDHSQGPWFYEMQELGYNCRLTDIQAALGLSQLRRAEEGLRRRQAIAKRYCEAFKGSGIRPLVKPESYSHAYHLFVVTVQDRSGFYEHLRRNGILAQVHYYPVCKMPYYRQLLGEVSCPVAEHYYEHCISLPMYPALTDQQQERVIGTCLDFFS